MESKSYKERKLWSLTEEEVLTELWEETIGKLRGSLTPKWPINYEG